VTVSACEPPGPGTAAVREPAAQQTPAPGAAAVPECYGDVCITCSDTAVEVTVVRLLPDGLAVVDTGQGEEEVSVALVQAEAGDTILVHAKEAIAVVGR
jgi:hydrogenase expression/formation protein HypC